jgi:hypothetical protein
MFLSKFRDNLSIPFARDYLPLKKGPIECPETSLRNYQYSLLNKPEVRSSHLLPGGSLKSAIGDCFGSRIGLEFKRRENSLSLSGIDLRFLDHLGPIQAHTYN